MILVDYSDSEISDGDEKSVANTAPKTSTNPAKPAFQKVVGRSNPHKIRVSLPDTSSTDKDHETIVEGPPAKRMKTGVGTFSGFNSFLPAPKRAVTSSKALAADGTRKGGLGNGINLKTGSAPGFSREPMPGVTGEDDEQPVPKAESYNAVPEQPEIEPASGIIQEPDAVTRSTEEVKKLGSLIMFKPLSVARKPQKKKKPPLVPPTTTAVSQSNGATLQSKPAPKKSLFSMGEVEEARHDKVADHGEYRPLVYEAPDQPTAPQSPPFPTETRLHGSGTTTTDVAYNTPTSPDPNPQSLSTIAADLNLSASARRQLLGRQRNTKGNPSAINIVNFNTDQEYAANEVLRQAGEQGQHNPVRAIAPGKHSLKQLVSAASNQKDALEEQFASGKRNKKEAGSKYGW
ncbi:hypothetical protein MMC08_000204 [Hypocenomyce scalaris]|nr:hypothetical protein [Hypocenomyce scalaris]